MEDKIRAAFVAKPPQSIEEFNLMVFDLGINRMMPEYRKCKEIQSEVGVEWIKLPAYTPSRAEEQAKFEKEADEMSNPDGGYGSGWMGRIR